MLEEEAKLLRDQMVTSQLVARRIKDERVLDAMRAVPRHLFVPESEQAAAYEDCALPIGEGQTISQPYMVAAMTELMELKGEETVLEVGTGSGYQAAILSMLAKKVFTIERIEALSLRAAKLLKSLNYNNIELITGDGTEGHKEGAPYDAIVVTAACPEIPKPLTDQLKDGGRLVLPLGERFRQTLVRVTKIKGNISLEKSFDCIFVPLLGKYGFREE